MNTPDDLTLRIGGASISGWTQLRVTRGMERVPSDFDIVMTERFPGELNAVTVVPGAPCQVLLGTEVVITGYVDRFTPSLSPQGHQVRVVGRGKCCDLVDCSAEWPGGQISGTSALDVATKLAAPYGIAVTLAPGVSSGPSIPQFNLILGETAWELIERVCRYAALVPFELADGSLQLAQVGTTAHASGFAQGQNVMQASIQYGMDQRYSRYVAFLQSVENLGDQGAGGVDGNVLAVMKDHTVSRHRQLDIIAEAGAGGQDIAITRAQWELARRWGRSFVCRLTTDSWRDAQGDLWQPNRLALVDLPLLKTAQAQWLIGEVSFHLDAARGTTAELTLMPPEAFAPQPTLLQPAWLMELTSTLPTQLGPSSGFLTMAQLTNQATGGTP